MILADVKQEALVYLCTWVLSARWPCWNVPIDKSILRFEQKTVKKAFLLYIYSYNN